MAQDLEPWSACDGALKLAQKRYEESAGKYGLPPRADFSPDFLCPLGQEEFDLWVYTQLCNAGVAVELIKNGGQEGEPMYQAVQIVDDEDMVSAMGVIDPMNITYCDWNDMLGLQVKLKLAAQWRVSITDDNISQHNLGALGGGRGGRPRAAASKTSIQNARLFEVTVDVPGHGVRCCAAVARMITINIAFQTEVDTQGITRSKWKNKLPCIQQRRIDILFTNAYFCSVQVRVPEHVFQNAERNTERG